MRTDAESASASDRGVPEGLATPTASGTDTLDPRGSKSGDAESLPPRSLFTRNTRSLRASARSLERSSSRAVHGVEARASGRRKASASRPVQCAHQKHLYAVDHSARASMKSAASCVN